MEKSKAKKVVKKVVKEKKLTKKERMPTVFSSEHSFIDMKGKVVNLVKIVKKGDWWALVKRDSIMYILTHNFIKHLADLAGISKDVDYTVLVQPSHENDYSYVFQCKIHDHKKVYTTEVGEANRSNLNTRGRNNPANMAQKRAYDRAVLSHLKIYGILGEDELPEPEDKTYMENLSPEEAKQIAPSLNEVFACNTIEELIQFRDAFKEVQGEYTVEQVNQVKTAYGNRLSAIEQKKF